MKQVFIFVSPELHSEQASKMERSQVNSGVPACPCHTDMPAFGVSLWPGCIRGGSMDLHYLVDLALHTVIYVFTRFLFQTTSSSSASYSKH